MKLGLFGINANACALDPEGAVRVAQAAEAAGWESVWTGEHYVLPEPAVPESPARGDMPLLDPFVALAHLAAHTRSLLLGTGVTVVPLHQPLALAKRVASIERVSNGRFLFGVGVGYLRPEFDALGAPFDRRGERTDEALDAMEAIWREEAVAGMRAEPRPTAPPPVHVGGSVTSSYRRAVTRGHGWYGWSLDVDGAAQAVDALRQVEGEVERPTSLPPLEISVTPDPTREIDRETVDAFAELGVTRLVIVPPRAGRRETAELVRWVEELPRTL
jgi:probable F420-dependent oxidoreductase